MDRKELERFILSTYHAQEDFPFREDPVSEVFRHPNNRKWFALVMEIPMHRLGVPSDEVKAVLNLKCDPLLAASLIGSRGIYPAYHMSKRHWITAVLESVPDDMLMSLLDMSFSATDVKVRKHRRKETELPDFEN